MKVVVKYGKLGLTRFASHRDFVRVLERGLRRAEIPMAYSSGFSPHPRVSYINPAPTGVESVAEYLSLALSRIINPEEIRQRLDEVMPDGFPILEVSPFTPDQSWPASRWQVDLPEADPAWLLQAVRAFLAHPEVLVSREVKTGLRTFDARSAVTCLGVEDHTCTMVIRHQDPLVRPDDVLTALCHLTPELVCGVPMIRRLWQGTETG